MLSVSIKYKGKKQQYVFPIYMLYFSERRSIIYNKPYIYIHTHTPQIKYFERYNILSHVGMIMRFDLMLTWDMFIVH